MSLSRHLTVAIVVGATITGCSFGREDATSPATTTSPAPAAVADPPPSPPPPLPTGPVDLAGVAVKLTEAGKVEDPSAMAARSGDLGLYVAERPGHVRKLTVVPIKGGPDGQTVIRTDTFIERGYVMDLSGEVSTEGEGGLVGMAFSSDGRKLYVSFVDRDGALRVVEHRLFDTNVDLRSRRDLLAIPLPSHERVGGQLAFGPDGFLYVGVGDGGDAHAAQDPHSQLGKVLRIDPEGGIGDIAYAIPDSNPYRDGSQGAPEVWLTGLGDPRFSFDPATGNLWITDHRDQREVITILPRFGNRSGRGADLAQPGAEGYVAPIFEYPHDATHCDAVGGAVYQGPAIPALAGAFVYGDRCGGEIRGIRLADAKMSDERSLGASLPPGALAGFATDTSGEIWVIASTGQVLRVDPI